MYHLHFESIDSTQIYLKEKVEELLNLDPNKNILISCQNQTAGIGRTGNAWVHQNKSLAFSFTIKPCSEISLTTIEMGILIRQFFLEKYSKEIFLKWPNDLMNIKKEKVGGIISNFHSNEMVIVGIGINMTHQSSRISESNQKISSLEINVYDFKVLYEEIYQYILNNRIKLEDIKNKFEASCIHLNQKVIVNDHHSSKHGFFKGIDQTGNMILENETHHEIKINSGHLTFVEE